MVKKVLSLLSLLWLSHLAFADVTILVAIEPSARKDGFMVARDVVESRLSKVLAQTVKVTSSEDLTDAMRATRSGGFDVFISPAQVAASALAHGYELAGATEGNDQYVLVAAPKVGSVEALRHGRIYLPQQDSIYTYMARGLLNASGLSFKDLNKVEFASYPQAGLTAVAIRQYEATVVRRPDFEAWQRVNPGLAQALSTFVDVPGGFSVAMKKSLPGDTRQKLAKWFEAGCAACGIKPVQARTDLAPYKKVAALGTFTPTSLPGATVVDLKTVKQLVAEEGAVIVDTRIEPEYKARHIPGALWLPYGEKSLKDVAFDASADSFPGLASLDKGKNIIFHCNGPECWKSYKASRAALKAGYAHIFWFRGGMPEWEAAGEPVESVAADSVAVAR